MWCVCKQSCTTEVCFSTIGSQDCLLLGLHATGSTAIYGNHRLNAPPPPHIPCPKLRAVSCPMPLHRFVLRSPPPPSPPTLLTYFFYLGHKGSRPEPKQDHRCQLVPGRGGSAQQRQAPPHGDRRAGAGGRLHQGGCGPSTFAEPPVLERTGDLFPQDPDHSCIPPLLTVTQECFLYPIYWGRVGSKEGETGCVEHVTVQAPRPFALTTRACV